MAQNWEKILDEAVTKLRQGHSKAEVLSAWPEHKDQLAPLLDAVLMLSGMPKKNAPQPAMQRKYIAAPAKRLWLHWVHISRFAAVSMSVLFLTAVGASSGYAAYKSQPGDIFFTLKKAAEHVQVELATDPQQKLSLQIAIAQKRLSNAQAVLKDSQDPNRQAAALSELAAETQKTADALNKAAQEQSPSSVTGGENTIIASLDAITSQQQELLNGLAENKNVAVSPDIITAAQENVTKVATIKQHLETAGREQALAALQSNPNAVTATGTIIQLTYASISINDKLFFLNGETLIKNDKGENLTSNDLRLKQSVQILGDNTATGLVARQITIITDAGKVKGDSTAEPAPAPSSQPGTKPTSTPISTEIFTPLPDPNTAIGTFIIEDPKPQTDYKE